MEGTKKWYASRAIWGGIIAVAAALLNTFGYNIDEATQSQLADHIVDGIALVGGLLAIWGRITAKDTIK